MKLIKSFLSAIFMLYVCSVFTTMIYVGMNDKISPQNELYGSIYSAIGFIVLMIAIIYNSGEVKNEN